MKGMNNTMMMIPLTLLWLLSITNNVSKSVGSHKQDDEEETSCSCSVGSSSSSDGGADEDTDAANADEDDFDSTDDDDKDRSRSVNPIQPSMRRAVSCGVMRAV